MAKAHIVAIAVLIAIFASWTVLGTAETIYDALSLMVLWRLSPAEKKTRNLVILALCVAVAWIDHFVIDFTFSSIFLLGRQWTLLWLNLSCLTFIRPRHEGQDDVAPAIPRIVRLSSMSLIVAGLGGWSNHLTEVVPFLSCLRHCYFMQPSRFDLHNVCIIDFVDSAKA